MNPLGFCILFVALSQNKQGVPKGTPCLFAEHLATRNLVRATRARGEFAKQICASIVSNRGLVLNPVRSTKEIARGARCAPLAISFLCLII